MSLPQLDSSHWGQDLTGMTIEGYELIKILGKGVEGSVYIGQTKDGKEVAIKAFNKIKKESYTSELNSLKRIQKHCKDYLLCYIYISRR